MITYEEALARAKALNPNINVCVEYKDAYMFGRNGGKVQYGGEGAPVVILKKTGKAISMAAFAGQNDSEPIREIKIK